MADVTFPAAPNPDEVATIVAAEHRSKIGRALPFLSRSRQRAVSAARRCLKAAVFLTIAHPVPRQCRSSGNDVSLPLKSCAQPLFLDERVDDPAHCIDPLNLGTRPLHTPDDLDTKAEQAMLQSAPAITFSGTVLPSCISRLQTVGCRSY